jgi:hypothetical protein
MHPIATKSVRPRHTVSPLRVRRFLITRRVGNRTTGNSASALAAPGSVSVKTTVTWKVPEGVVDEVVMVTAPAVDEYVHVAPVGRLRHLAVTFVAEDGKVTG